MRKMPPFQKRIVRAAAVASGVIGVALIGLAAPARLFAQTGGACIPVNERTTEYGCFVHAEQHLQELPNRPVYWHIDRFADRSSAQAAKSTNGTVVEILGTVWLFTIAGESWRPSAGEHIADVGPLTLPQASSLMATYMEGNFRPGMQSTIHRHPGTEAWFVLTGAQCLETPHGEQLGRPGAPPVIVPPGEPMLLTGIGKEQATGWCLSSWTRPCREDCQPTTGRRSIRANA
ncbi:hypothetical protein [Caballeronia sp. GAFFF1]|uniref:hypothetical protein n=1 Tax=Caballeronia sp. GAFFF1 TaxID=2921779 RepID=UPI00202916D6|nr:hypothetical protein [Caballeronia sp. GAFFF1]